MRLDGRRIVDSDDHVPKNVGRLLGVGVFRGESEDMSDHYLVERKVKVGMRGNELRKLGGLY